MRRAVLREGYAAPAATGPAGATCGGCRFCKTYRVPGSGARASSCDKARAANGGRFAGEIYGTTPACSEFQPKRGRR